MTLTNAQKQDPRSMMKVFPDQSPAQVAGGSSSSKGAATAVEDVIDLSGSSSRSTFLAKREC